jgi:hypothetical protein
LTQTFRFDDYSQKIPISILAWGVDINLRRDALSEGIRGRFSQSQFELVAITEPSALQLYLDLPEEISNSDFFGTNPALVVFEPRIVNPYEYRKDVLARFNHVIGISPLQKLNDQAIEWRQGQIPETVTLSRDHEISFIRSRSLTVGIINENKQSLVSGSQYATRVRAIRSLSRAGFCVVVAGRNWDRPLRWLAFKYLKEYQRALRGKTIISLANLYFFRPTSKDFFSAKFVGAVKDAVGFLKTVDVALVIENENNYVSEKLFQALLAGALPIYLGPPLKDFDIPRVALEFSGSASDLPHFLEALDPNDALEVLRTGREWISSPEARRLWGVNESQDRLVLLVEKLLLT